MTEEEQKETVSINNNDLFNNIIILADIFEDIYKYFPSKNKTLTGNYMDICQCLTFDGEIFADVCKCFAGICKYCGQ